MKIGHLIELLEQFDPELEVVIKRDVELPGYGFIDRIEVGVFALTEYGNDFHLFEDFLVGVHESRAICLVAEDDKPEEEAPRL